MSTGGLSVGGQNHDVALGAANILGGLGTVGQKSDISLSGGDVNGGFSSEIIRVESTVAEVPAESAPKCFTNGERKTWAMRKCFDVDNIGGEEDTIRASDRCDNDDEDEFAQTARLYLGVHLHLLSRM